MSQWTHINGSIRIDSLLKVDEYTLDVLDEVMGPTCDFDSPDWKAVALSDTPCGSEGSLHWHFHPYEKADKSISKGQIIIWGDLRDFGREQVPILDKYFNRIFSHLQRMPFRMRAMSIDIDFEDQGSWRYFLNEKNLIEVSVVDYNLGKHTKESTDESNEKSNS